MMNNKLWLAAVVIALAGCQSGNNAGDQQEKNMAQEVAAEKRPPEISIELPSPPSAPKIPNDGNLDTDEKYAEYVAYKQQLAAYNNEVSQYTKAYQKQIAQNQKLIESQWRWADPVSEMDLVKTYSIGETYFLDKGTVGSGKMIANYLIDPKGHVIGVKVAESSFDTDQTQALIKGIMLERFKPMGKTVSSKRTIVLLSSSPS